MKNNERYRSQLEYRNLFLQSCACCRYFCHLDFVHERTRSNSNKEKGQKGSYIELTGKSSLQGEKEKGIDDYTGTYTADYANFSGTEYLFGGTSIKREAGKELSIDCTLEITEGTAKVFWISGSDEAVTLIEATGTYSDTITLPDGGNYIGIECENFTGNIELNIE